MDRAHVLSKIQVGEVIEQCQMWDHHSDGTTRDHNKIVGTQINTECGTLSAGFSGVASEDATTLLDNAISMMKNLSMSLMMALQNLKKSLCRNQY